MQELEPTNNMGAIMRSPDEPKVFSDTTLKGFETINHSVSKISNAYNNIELIYERYAQEQMAIATDKANRKAVIFQNGSVLNNFDFKFSEIDYFNNEEGQIFFITKELNQNTYKIYDKSGKLVYDKTIDGYSYYSNYQWDKIRGNVYIGYPEIFKISVGEKQNIFSKIKLTTLLPKNYDKIESINGPSDDVNREGTVGNNGLIALFFLVNDAANTFYVDEKGVEYKVKK